VLIHQPLIMRQIAGPAVDINIQADAMENTHNGLNKILTESPDQPIGTITQDIDRDFFKNARQATE
jgi:ATP-dependent protease ClpP protease subunit